METERKTQVLRLLFLPSRIPEILFITASFYGKYKL